MYLLAYILLAVLIALMVKDAWVIIVAVRTPRIPSQERKMLLLQVGIALAAVVMAVSTTLVYVLQTAHQTIILACLVALWKAHAWNVIALLKLLQRQDQATSESSTAAAG